MLKLVDKLLLSRSGNYSLRVRLSLPLNSLNFNITGPNLSDFYISLFLFTHFIKKRLFFIKSNTKKIKS